MGQAKAAGLDALFAGYAPKTINRCLVCNLSDPEVRAFIERQKGKTSANRVHSFLIEQKRVEWRTAQPISTHWGHP